MSHSWCRGGDSIVVILSSVEHRSTADDEEKRFPSFGLFQSKRVGERLSSKKLGDRAVST